MADKLRVVIVDDSRSALNQLTQLIEEIEGTEVVGTAPDGLTGVTLVAQKKPDLVLMDIIMPHLDGLAALRMIRTKNPEIRVAVITSVAGTRTRAEEAFRLGAVQVLGKPVDRDQLEALIERERAARDECGGGAR